MISVFEHPWLGALFGDDAVQALWDGNAQIAHYLAFEAALAQALEDAGRVAPGQGADAADAIRTFVPDIDGLASGTAQDGLPIPALIKALRAASPYPEAVHTGATSQDVLDTALALTLQQVTTLLLTALTDLDAALATLAARFGERPMMARTRMQAALPITAHDRIASWRAPITAHKDRLTSLRLQTEILQLGGPVGTRQGWDSHADQIASHMAGTLGLAVAPHVWHSDRTGVADYGNALSLITGSLGKLGQDICLMAQQGIDEITIASGGASSAMPHKANPIAAETLVTLARFNATQVAGLHHALVHEQERSGAAWMLEWMTLPPMTIATAASLATATRLIDSIQCMGDSAA